MKLLVITQVLDKQDANLGFFHTWIEKLAAQCEQVIVIVLKKGEYSLPANVTVLSLGKEKLIAKHYTLNAIRYSYRFYRYIFSQRHGYDAVFVHMNPEYAILGGFFWRFWGKKVLLWYTHKAVNIRLRLAVLLATKIFTASKTSFRLPSKKAEIVGHGIDLSAIPDRTKEIGQTLELLSVGRVSSVKDLESVILAVNLLAQKQISVHLDIIGSAITRSDAVYKQTLVQLVHKLHLEKCVRFVGAIPHEDLLKQYAQHDIFVHTSKTGSIDKVVLESMAAGLSVVTSSDAFREIGDLIYHIPCDNPDELAQSIEKIFQSGILSTATLGRKFVEQQHNLDNLIGKIINYFKP